MTNVRELRHGELGANINARAVKALAQHWQEGLSYGRAGFDMTKGNALADLEEKKSGGVGLMIRTPAVRKIAKGAGAVVLGLVALDLFATVVTLALGWSMVKR